MNSNRLRGPWFAAILAAGGLAQAAAAQQATPLPDGYKVEESLLGSYSWTDKVGLLPTISADGHHIASFADGHACPNGTKRCIVVDGKSIAAVQGIVRNLALSPDGGRVAYADYDGKKSWVVVDGRAEPSCDGCVISGLTFSLDGKRLAYIAGKDNRTRNPNWMVVDGKAGTKYDQVVHPAFSPDDQHVAYVAKTGSQWSVVVDDRSGPAYDDIDGPVFSPDSKRMAYGVRQGKKWSMVVDGRAGLAYDDFFRFGGDGGGAVGPSLANIQIASQWTMMDGQQDTPYLEFSTKRVGYIGDEYATRMFFSPDSKHFAYAAKRNGKFVVVVDGQEGAECEELGEGSPALSPDGRRTAYSKRTGLGQNWRVVADGQEGSQYAAVYNPSFSPDGKHLAYVAVPQGWHANNKWIFVLDGREGPIYSSIDNWAFSPDGRHAAYVAMVSNFFAQSPDPFGGGMRSVILDGKAGAEYDLILPNTLSFGSDGTLEFLAVRREDHSKFGFDHYGQLFRVKYTPVP